jgi:pilus assembly protein Flp/PilA
MRRPVRSFVAFLRNESGPTAVEYAVMLALIIVVCIAAIAILGRDARRDFRVVGRTLRSGS